MARSRPLEPDMAVTTSLSVCCSFYEDLTDVDRFDGVRGSNWVNMKGSSWLGAGPGARTCL